VNSFRWQAVIAGVGGQGVLFATRVLAHAALDRSENVLVSEVHGMAQRGGSVVSHLKIGNHASPLVASGRADLLFALEAGEAVRNLAFLVYGGFLVVNAPDLSFLSPEGRRALEEHGVRCLAVNAAGLACRGGGAKGSNVVLLGAAAAFGVFPFPPDHLARVLVSSTPPERRELNQSLFTLGADAGTHVGCRNHPAPSQV